MMSEVHGELSVYVVGRQPGPLPGVLAEGGSAGQNSCNLRVPDAKFAGDRNIPQLYGTCVSMNKYE